MKFSPGDILVISGKNLAIKLGTASIWTHVGIVYDDKHILEANIENAYDKRHRSGLYLTDFDTFLSKGKQARLIKRKQSLSQKDRLEMQKYYEQNKVTPFSITGAGLSGLIPIQRVISVGYFALFASLSFLAGVSNLDVAYFSMAAAFLLCGLVCWVISDLSVRYSHRSEKFATFLRKLGVSEEVLSIHKKHFCSKVVADVDEVVGGSIKAKLTRTDVARPKDILNICERSKSYSVHTIQLKK